MKTYPPYKKGFFKVTDGHKLYYELYGNPRGIPVVFVHGGPGAGFHEKKKASFDKRKYNVLLYDQRGSGRSKPFASTKNNTTPKLIEDLRKIMDFTNFKKAILVGGSWGSTLVLAFSIKYPSYVTGLVLRAIFIASKKYIDYYVKGGVKEFFPEVWGRFIAMVPTKYRNDVSSYYITKMKSKNAKVSEKYCYEWARYEISISRLVVSENQIKKTLKVWSYKSLAPLEAHYMKNNCFLPENYILKNAHELSHIPASIVHGRYDAICPINGAYLLHKAIKGSRYKVVLAGHNEKSINEFFKNELAWVTARIK